MKKFLITISIIAALGLSVNAQDYYQYSSSDGFFSSNSMTPGYRSSTGEDLPLLPMRGQLTDQSAPIGSGLLLLLGMGLLMRFVKEIHKSFAKQFIEVPFIIKI